MLKEDCAKLFSPKLFLQFIKILQTNLFFLLSHLLCFITRQDLITCIMYTQMKSYLLEEDSLCPSDIRNIAKAHEAV